MGKGKIFNINCLLKLFSFELFSLCSLSKLEIAWVKLHFLQKNFFSLSAQIFLFQFCIVIKKNDKKLWFVRGRKGGIREAVKKPVENRLFLSCFCFYLGVIKNWWGQLSYSLFVKAKNYTFQQFSSIFLPFESFSENETRI